MEGVGGVLEKWGAVQRTSSPTWHQRQAGERARFRVTMRGKCNILRKAQNSGGGRGRGEHRSPPNPKAQVGLLQEGPAGKGLAASGARECSSLGKGRERPEVLAEQVTHRKSGVTQE